MFIKEKVVDFVKKLTIWIAFLNIFDGVATYLGIINKIIEEVNPIMRYCWELSPVFFIFVKLIMSFLIYLVGFKVPERRYLKVMLIIVLSIYIGLAIYHLFWFNMYISKK